MGNKVPGKSISKDKQASVRGFQRSNFDFLYVIGRGGFGKVWKVICKKYKKPYAMKEMSKAKVIDKRSERSIKYERELLSRMDHPFIVNMSYSFQDTENLYIVMDLLNGGDLRYHISRRKRFSEEQTKFFVCCMLLALEYIHLNNIIHRDIKPENLVLDDKGYMRLTDFGIAKISQKDNSSETSGTPGYMAPEVMCAMNHTIMVDYFALGVFTYEFMNGKRPYLGRSRKEIKELIMAKQVQVKKNDIPSGWSLEAADFINRLLQRKPVNRLGLKGPGEVKDHAWIKYFNWKDLYEKKIESPFIPKIGDNFDKRYCEAPDKLGNDTKERYEKYLKNENFAMVFKNFEYFYDDMNKEKKIYNPHLSLCQKYDETKSSNSNHSKIKFKIYEKSPLDTKLNKTRKFIPNSFSNSSLLKNLRSTSISSSRSTGGTYNLASLKKTGSRGSISSRIKYDK